MTTTVYMIGSYIWKLSLVLLDYLSIIEYQQQGFSQEVFHMIPYSRANGCLVNKPQKWGEMQLPLD